MHNFFHLSKFVIVALFFVTSCSKNVNNIDVSNVDLNLKIVRFEKELMETEIDSLENKIPYFELNYLDFFEIFNYKIINIGGTNVKEYPIYLKKFASDYLILEVYKKSSEKFENFDNIENELNNAFKHYKYYFPQKQIPTIYTFISGFNQSIVTSDSFVSIGLDKYLGENSEYYSKLNIPKYSRKNMTPNKIIPDVMFAWAIREFPYNDSVDDLLNQMIYNGKIMYFLDLMIPESNDDLKMGYTQSQLNWCEKNEKKMWTFLVENKMLFKSDYMEIKSFINDGPFTKSFSQSSPPKTGIWIGWQIVRSYMKNNKVSIQELMENSDYQKILNQSKYRP